MLYFEEMGAPPREKSTAGRANVNGIPCLYLCDESETVLYEVRAAYLDEISVGTFIQKDKNKQIKIADFSSTLSLYANYFEPDWTDLIKSRLLTSVISRDLSKPMRRYDSELEYIPTQFICEFTCDMWIRWY